MKFFSIRGNWLLALFQSERHNQFWIFLFEANSLKPKTVVAVAPSINVDSFACVLSFFKALFLSRFDFCRTSGNQKQCYTVVLSIVYDFQANQRWWISAFCFLLKLFSLEENYCIVFCTFFAGDKWCTLDFVKVLTKYLVSLSCWRKGLSWFKLVLAGLPAFSKILLKSLQTQTSLGLFSARFDAGIYVFNIHFNML